MSLIKTFATQKPFRAEFSGLACPTQKTPSLWIFPYPCPSPWFCERSSPRLLKSPNLGHALGLELV